MVQGHWGIAGGWGRRRRRVDRSEADIVDRQWPEVRPRLLRRAGEFGVRVPDGVTVDFPAVMERMRLSRRKAREYIEQVDPSFRAQRFYAFDGGCGWWDFDFDEGAPAALAISAR